MIDATTRNQFIRFATVGLLSNALLYLAYLALTAVGMHPVPAMSLLYLTGVAQTFILNKRWSFGYQGSQGRALIRYLLVYGVGYLLNLGVLLVFVERLKWPHQVVQGLMIPVLAVAIFLLQKLWVFRPSSAV